MQLLHDPSFSREQTAVEVTDINRIREQDACSLAGTTICEPREYEKETQQSKNVGKRALQLLRLLEIFVVCFVSNARQARYVDSFDSRPG